MATPVRVNEDNYVKLQNEADTQRRSVVSQLNVILDERYGRNTVGVTPIIPPVPKKIANEPSAKDIKHVPDITKVSDLLREQPDADDILSSSLEQPCCGNDVRPCKHWVWDNVTGEGYKNTLSGRFREAE